MRAQDTNYKTSQVHEHGIAQTRTTVILWKKKFSITSKEIHMKTIRVAKFIDEQTGKNENTMSYLGMGNQAFPHNTGVGISTIFLDGNPEMFTKYTCIVPLMEQFHFQ
jgi:glycerol kinase